MDKPDLPEGDTPSKSEALLKAIFGNDEVLTEADDEEPIWPGPSSREIPFCELALLLRLRQRPYHLVTLGGPFNVKRMMRDHREALYRSERHFRKNAKLVVDRLMLCLGEEVFAYLDDGARLLVYGPTPQAAARAALRFRRYREVQKDEPKAGFRLVGISESGPYAEEIAVETPAPVSTQELALHYGEEFLDWEQRWIDRLKQRRSGVNILFGPPGCGKTSYLRGLMTRLLEEFVFYYLPTSCFDVLASPSFVGFWIKQSRLNEGKRQIAILEDAEDLLIPRDEANRVKVSNLLNVGDGFLGEHLKLHVIATTNIPIQKLDPALLRPGRLMGMRQFRRLSRADALRLCQAKGLKLLRQEEDFSLAELYNPPQSVTSLGQLQSIGFGPHPPPDGAD